MKVYALVTSGYDSHHTHGIYSTKEEALVDADFIAAEENRRNQDNYGRDDSFRLRMVKCDDIWYEQHQNKMPDEKWEEWPDPIAYHGDSLYVEEHDIRNLSLQEQVDAINEWQSNSRLHPLTCGKNSNHPNLIPHYDFNFSGIGLRCTVEECDWYQKPNHSILSIVYATYIRNRAQTAETWRLRELRQTQGDPSSHAGPSDEASR